MEQISKCKYGSNISLSYQENIYSRERANIRMSREILYGFNYFIFCLLEIISINKVHDMSFGWTFHINGETTHFLLHFISISYP